MKIDAKITRPEEIQRHLQEVSDFQISIKLFTETGQFLKTGIFFCEFDQDVGLHFIPIPPRWSEFPLLTCQYHYNEKICVFKSRSLEIGRGHLCMGMPESIMVFERRKFFRVTPAKDQPVSVTLGIPDRADLRTHASDISGGGFSVLLPQRMAFFQVDMRLSACVELPDGKEIQAQAVVRGKHNFMNIMRVGFEFLWLPEDERDKIMSYSVHRQLAMREATAQAGDKGWHAPRVCIVDSDAPKTVYSYLREKFVIETVDHLNAISHLRKRPYDLIVLNGKDAGARLVLQTASRDHVLKEVPLIVLGQANGHVKNRAGGLMSIKTPYKKKHLLKSMVDFIGKARLSNQIEGAYWQYFTGGGKKIMVVDPQNNLGAFPYKILEELGFQLFRVEGAMGIIAQIEKVLPDLLLLDSETGSMDPTTLCRLMNMNKVVKKIPKIRLLAGGDIPQSSLFDNTGLHFLNKPLDIEQLLQGVNKALGRNLEP